MRAQHADEIQEQIELIIIELDGLRSQMTSTTNTRAPRARDISLRESIHDTCTERHSAEESERREPPPSEEREVSDPEEPHVDPLTTEDSESIPAGLLPRSPHIKLPKLSLKTFGGDLTKQTTFWDTFESSIHQNPTLTIIDKFSYLNSLLESTASEAVAGLTLTSSNYEEAMSTLKRRFGNKQSIINRHIELLLHLEPVTSVRNLKGQLFDAVESNMRGLKALRVSASSYGGLMSPILMSRLPSELRLIVSRELSENEWNVEVVMEIVRREIEAREHSAGATSPRGKKPTPSKLPPRALSLTAGASSVCVLQPSS